MSYYTVIRSISKIACCGCGRMIDAAASVYLPTGFHHCPPGACLNERLVKDPQADGQKKISPNALIFSVKSDTT